MNPIYRIWWRLLMDLRPLARYSAERFPHLASPAVRLRTVAHFMVGSPWHPVISVYGLVLWNLFGSFVWGFIAWASSAVAVELVFQVVRARGGHAVLVWLVGWREAWRVRRRWPADWAMVAAKTTRVQAEVGTSKEPIASARLRPIADHPKMGWLPRVEWPVVSWWAGPPPGRSFAALEDVTAPLAASISHCIDVAVDFDRESDSHGRLIVTFDNPLAAAVAPAVPEIDLSTERPTVAPDPDAVDDRVRAHLVPVPDAGWEGF